MISEATASLIAIVLGVSATITVAAIAVRTWLTWRRVDRTRDAAASLVDVHMSALQERAQLTSRLAERATMKGADLGVSVSTLHQHIDALRQLLTRVRDEHDLLKRRLLDLVLPTREQSDERDRVKQ